METALLLLYSSQRLLEVVVRLLYGVLEAAELLHGAIQTALMTAPEFKIGAKMLSRFMAQRVLLDQRVGLRLLHSWQVELW
jgi:hypothetical protein